METRLIYITAADAEEARKIGRLLVEERLVACANVLGRIDSIYRWEGAIQEDAEVALIAKTTASLVSRVVERVSAVHSYSCPCVVALPIADGNPAFLNWIAEETA